MLTKLRDFFLGLGSKDFEQDQNEAMLTLLVWVMQADGKIAAGESSKINDFIEAVNWNSDLPATAFVKEVSARIATIESGELSEEDLMKECSSKLKGSDIRYKAVKICHELAKADNYFDNAEKHLLKLFSKTLI